MKAVAAVFAAGLSMMAASAAPGTLLPPETMGSAAIGSATVTVWLPPGYENTLERHPVLYMQDGQNLFDGAVERTTSPWRKVWGVDSVAARLIGERKIRSVIIVAVDHRGAERARQYYPEAAFDRLPDSVRQSLAARFGGSPLSDAYLTFLVKELKPAIDKRYRTEPGRESTFVMGSSMGGLISLYALSEYPDVFGGAGCLSTHWLLAVPGDNTVPSETLFSALERYVRDRRPPPARLWFDHGTVGLDAGYGPYQARIDALLTAQGWRRGVDFESTVYQGADHNEDAWRARLEAPMIYLLGLH